MSADEQGRDTRGAAPTSAGDDGDNGRWHVVSADPAPPFHGEPRVEPASPSAEAFGRGVDEREPEAFGKAPAAKDRDRQKPADKKKPDGGDAEEDPKDDKAEGGKKDAEKQDDPEKDDGQPKKPPLYKRPVPMMIIGVVVIALVIAGLLLWLYFRQYASTDDAFIDGHVVQINPNVSAYVKTVQFNDNQQVKRGQVLAELDPRDYEVIVEQMKANLDSATDKREQSKTQLEVAEAQVGEAAAQVTVAETNARNAEDNFRRYTSLDPRARSQQALDDATAANKSQAAQVEQAKAHLAAMRAQVDDAKSAIKANDSAVKRAEADLHQAEINLGYCTVVAPEDGYVTRKSVEPGDYVAKGQALLSIVPTDVWVTANYKETQLSDMRIGQPVTIKVDAYPDYAFRGHVDSIQNGTGSQFSLLPPENATGNFVKVVQRVPVKIVFEPGENQVRDHLLAPGMSVEPSVKVK